MKILHSSEGNVAVLTLEGNLTIGAADAAFSDTIERMLERDQTEIVLDMKLVDLVDSTGLGSLVRCHHRCVQAGGGLRLTNLKFQVWELFETARINGIIPIFEDLRMALKG